MAVTVRIPTTLRPLAGGSSTVQVEGAVLSEVIANLEAAHAGFADMRHHGLSKNPSGARDLDAPELFVMTGVRN